MTISEKVAYLKGLTEGMGIDTEAKEGKLISLVTDILQDVALELEDLQTEQAELGDEIDAVSDDLNDVESILYDEDEDEEDDEDEDFDDDEDCYASTCPNCGDEIYFDDSVLESGEVVCPGCGTKLNFDLSSLADEDEDKGDEEDE